MAIPTKAKNVLLLPVTNGWLSQPFNMSGFPNYNKNNPTHNGIDIGSYNGKRYVPVLACQDGKVVEVIKNDVSGSRGNGVVLEHTYEDGTHRWTGYIHLKDTPTVKVGQFLKQGEQLGIRGGSPYVNGKAKYGVHLHLYVTKPNKSAYKWSTLKEYITDPYPFMYKSKALEYELTGVLDTIPWLEDAIPEVVAPVERNESVDQLMEKSSILRVRMTPSLKGAMIGYLKANAYYNYYDVANADGYDWYKIAEDQWVAKTDTMILYPAKTELDILKEQVGTLESENASLKVQVEQLTQSIDKISKSNSQLLNKIASIRQITMSD